MAVARLELSTFSETQLVEAGKMALKERRYDTAVQMFDYAWTRLKTKDASKLRAKTIWLLDLLVEARIGLSRFDRAFKDASTMVRCDRTDARGYIRCGQLKRLQGSPQAALDFYAKGLQNVSTDQKLYKVLQTQHDQTSRATVTLSLPADPFSVLPAEILQMILSYFTYRDATSLLRVSKTWSKTVLATHPTIAISLDFSASQRSISRAAFLACLRRLSRSPSTLVAEHLSRGATRVLLARLQSWTLLTILKLRKVNLDVASVRWSKLKLREMALGEEQRVTTTLVLKILDNCPRLKTACFASVRKHIPVEDMMGQVAHPNLEKFTLSGTPAPQLTVAGQSTALQWPAAFVQRLPKLKELTLSRLSLTGFHRDVFDFSALSELRSLILSDLRLEHFVVLPQSLEVLRCVDILALPGQPLWQPLWHSVGGPTSTNAATLANLKTIQFHRVNYGAVEVFRRLPAWPDKTSLTSLDLSEWQYSISWLVQFLEAGKAREVEHLRLYYSGLDDDLLEVMTKHCPSLEALHLWDSSVTGVFIKGLVDALGIQLKRITLEGLEPKVSFDAVKWAQERGVTMMWRNHMYPGVSSPAAFDTSSTELTGRNAGKA